MYTLVSTTTGSEIIGTDNTLLSKVGYIYAESKRTNLQSLFSAVNLVLSFRDLSKLIDMTTRLGTESVLSRTDSGLWRATGSIHGRSYSCK